MALVAAYSGGLRNNRVRSFTPEPRLTFFLQRKKVSKERRARSSAGTYVAGRPLANASGRTFFQSSKDAGLERRERTNPPVPWGGADGERENNIRHCWNELPSHYPHIHLDEFAIMPNHVHGIIIIRDFASVGARSSRPMETWQPETSRSSRPVSGLGNPVGRDDQNTGRDDRAPINATDGVTNATGDTEKPTARKPTLGNMVAYFKYRSTKRINAMRRNGIEKIWQRNYHDHIILDEKSLFNIRQYIRNNPLLWAVDSENHLNNEINQYNTEFWIER